MMKWAILIAVSAAALAACGKKEHAPTKASDAAPAVVGAKTSDDDVKMPAGFPKMTASYKGVYTLREGPNGKPQTMTMEIAGWKKVRSEMPHFNETKAAAGQKMIMVMDDKENRAIAYVEGPDAPNVAVVIPMEQSFFKEFRNWGAADGQAPKKIGSDMVAGVKCDIWETAKQSDAAVPDQACISKEGIFLWSKEEGATEPSIIATSIDKGSVPDSHFAVPTGAEIVDMGPCMKLGQEAMASARAGKKPDLAKMQECQAIGQKVATVMGG